MKIIEQIIKIGVCEKWQNQLTGSEDNRQLLSLLVGNEQVREWSIKYNFPAIENWRNEKELAAEYGVIVDGEVELNNVDYVMTIGKTTVVLNYTDRAVARIDARHDSQITVNAADYAIIRINIFDKAKVTVNSGSTAKVNIYKR